MYICLKFRGHIHTQLYLISFSWNLFIWLLNGVLKQEQRREVLLDMRLTVFVCEFIVYCALIYMKKFSSEGFLVQWIILSSLTGSFSFLFVLHSWNTHFPSFWTINWLSVKSHCCSRPCSHSGPAFSRGRIYEKPQSQVRVDGTSSSFSGLNHLGVTGTPKMFCEYGPRLKTTNDGLDLSCTGKWLFTGWLSSVCDWKPPLPHLLHPRRRSTRCSCWIRRGGLPLHSEDAPVRLWGDVKASVCVCVCVCV